MAHVNRMLDT